MGRIWEGWRQRERKRETGRHWNSVCLEEVNIVLMTKMRTEMGRREWRVRKRDEIWRNRGKERNIDYWGVCTCLA